MKKYLITISVLLALSLLGTCISAAFAMGDLGVSVSQGVSALGETIKDLCRAADEEGFPSRWDWEGYWDNWEAAGSAFEYYEDRQALPGPVTGLDLTNSLGEMTVQPSGTEESYYVLSCRARRGYVPAVSSSLQDGVLRLRLDKDRVNPLYYMKKLRIDLYLSQSTLESLSVVCSAGTFQASGLSFRQVEARVSAGEVDLSAAGSADTVKLLVSAGDLEYRGDAAALDAEVSAGDLGFEGKVSESCKVSVSAGSAELSLLSLPQNTGLFCTAGDISLEIPSDEGFTILQKSSSLSDCSFDFDLAKAVRDGKTSYTYLNGGKEISVSASAGSIEIQPGD